MQPEWGLGRGDGSETRIEENREFIGDYTAGGKGAILRDDECASLPFSRFPFQVMVCKLDGQMVAGDDKYYKRSKWINYQTNVRGSAFSKLCCEDWLSACCCFSKWATVRLHEGEWWPQAMILDIRGAKWGCANSTKDFIVKNEAGPLLGPAWAYTDGTQHGKWNCMSAPALVIIRDHIKWTIWVNSRVIHRIHTLGGCCTATLFMTYSKYKYSLCKTYIWLFFARLLCNSHVTLSACTDKHVVWDTQPLTPNP